MVPDRIIQQNKHAAALDFHDEISEQFAIFIDLSRKY